MTNISRVGPAELDRTLTAVESVPKRSAGRSYIADFLEDDGNLLIIAERSGVPVSLLLAHRLAKVTSRAPKYLIYEIEVEEKSRRTGIGSAIVYHLVKPAREDGVAAAFDITGPEHPGAREFYRSTGASVTGRDPVIFEYRL